MSYGPYGSFTINDKVSEYTCFGCKGRFVAKSVVAIISMNASSYEIKHSGAPLVAKFCKFCALKHINIKELSATPDVTELRILYL